MNIKGMYFAKFLQLLQCLLPPSFFLPYRGSTMQIISSLKAGMETCFESNGQHVDQMQAMIREKKTHSKTVSNESSV